MASFIVGDAQARTMEEFSKIITHFQWISNYAPFLHNKDQWVEEDNSVKNEIKIWDDKPSNDEIRRRRRLGSIKAKIRSQDPYCFKSCHEQYLLI